MKLKEAVSKYYFNNVSHNTPNILDEFNKYGTYVYTDDNEDIMIAHANGRKYGIGFGNKLEQKYCN